DMARLRSATRPVASRKNKNAAPLGRLSCPINIGKQGKGSIREGEIEKNLRSRRIRKISQNGRNCLMRLEQLTQRLAARRTMPETPGEKPPRRRFVTLALDSTRSVAS